MRLLEERVGCALVVRGQPCTATDTGRRMCQHMDRVLLLEQELHGTLPALATDTDVRVSLPVAVNADSLATWFAPAVAHYAAQTPVLMDIAVDDQDHTFEWLRNGRVLAAVTGTARAATGCSSQPLGAMRYAAVCSPAFKARYFATGVGAGTLARAPALVFNVKDELQSRWVHRLCHRHVELPRHYLPSAHAFVEATLAGMGWGLNPLVMVHAHLASGALVALLPDTPLDVPLHWQQARAASKLLEGLTRHMVLAASAALTPL